MVNYQTDLTGRFNLYDKVIVQKVKFCKIEELPEGKSIDKKVLARKIVVFNDNGKISAMESECKHMKAPLNMAEAVDGVVTCNWHDWKYDIKSGKCLTHENMDLKKFEIEISDGWIFILFDI